VVLSLVCLASVTGLVGFRFSVSRQVVLSAIGLSFRVGIGCWFSQERQVIVSVVCLASLQGW
jgi:hypothetical protein